MFCTIILYHRLTSFTIILFPHASPLPFPLPSLLQKTVTVVTCGFHTSFTSYVQILGWKSMFTNTWIIGKVVTGRFWNWCISKNSQRSDKLFPFRIAAVEITLVPFAFRDCHVTSATIHASSTGRPSCPCAIGPATESFMTVSKYRASLELSRLHTVAKYFEYSPTSEATSVTRRLCEMFQNELFIYRWVSSRNFHLHLFHFKVIVVCSRDFYIFIEIECVHDCVCNLYVVPVTSIIRSTFVFRKVVFIILQAQCC